MSYLRMLMGGFILLVLTVSVTLFGEDKVAEKKPSLKFIPGTKRSYLLKWTHYYEVKQKDQLKIMYVTKVTAALTSKVKTVFPDGKATIVIHLDELRIDKSGDDPKMKTYFDSSKDMTAEPGKYVKKDLTLILDQEGNIVTAPSIDSPHYAKVFDTVLLGKTWFHISPGLSKDKLSLPILHDGECASTRFRTAYVGEVPIKFKREIDRSEGFITVVGKPDSTKIFDIGVRGHESWFPKVKFSGQVKGVYQTKQGYWDAIDINLTGKTKMEGMEVALKWRLEIKTISKKK